MILWRGNRELQSARDERNFGFAQFTVAARGRLIGPRNPTDVSRNGRALGSRVGRWGAKIGNFRAIFEQKIWRLSRLCLTLRSHLWVVGRILPGGRGPEGWYTGDLGI